LKNEYHLSSQLFSYLFLINTIFIVLFQVWIVDVASKFNQFITAGIGALLVGFGMLMLIFGSSYPVAVISCFLWTIGEILFFPIVQMLLYDRASESTKAVHTGLYQAVFSFANVIGPMLGSWMYQFQHGALVWISCGVLGLISLLICLAYCMRQITIPLLNTPA
jgi:MFS family permease